MTPLRNEDILLAKRLEKRMIDDPGNAEIVTHLGALCFVNSEYKKAGVYLKKALELKPKNVEALYWYGRFLYFWGSKDPELKDVIEVMKEALESDSRCAKCLLLIYDAMYHRISPNEYISFLERAVELQPDWVSTNESLAETLFELGRFDEAEVAAKRALSLYENEARPNFDNGIDKYYYYVIMGMESKISRKALIELLEKITKKKRTIK